MQRPTGPVCDGCHSVNYDIRSKTVTEWNVGCEACHGAGRAHVLEPVADTIVNPAQLDPVRATDVCIQCHSQGVPHANPIGGLHYDWPVGYEPLVRIPGPAHALVDERWTWALRATVFVGVCAVGRLGLELSGRLASRRYWLPVAAADLAGLLLLFQTAERGGRLVYEHGVGVAAPR